MPVAVRQFDVLILGAGAAGLMCAGVASQRGRRVAVLDHNPTPGRKILISGGGRANFTNLHTAPENFLSENPHFAKSALALYPPQDFIELVDRAHIPWHEKTLGQLFCDRSAHDILNLLLAECERGKAEIVLNARNITVDRNSSGFLVHTSQGDFTAPSLVVATGGLSIPKLGATGLAYTLARQFGLRVLEPRPALVPLRLSGDEAAWTQLAGLSAAVVATVGKARFAEKMLITHRGLSGPAILQASSYWRPGLPLDLDLLPGCTHSPIAPLLDPRAQRDQPALRTALHTVLPQRMADLLAASVNSWTNRTLEDFAQKLRRFSFHPVGTEGFDKAEVTAGGVDTRDLEARTMQARSVAGLFFIGEAVDVTGHLGGFNFQWAWSSAVAAGRAI